MLSLKPIPEDAASKEVAKIYNSIKQTFEVANVPLIFQYLAVFPHYLDFIWQQAHQNLSNPEFKNQAKELERFALSRLHLIPHPLDSSITAIFNKAYDHPKFPELIYLVADLFPTQTPYKLMASAVMKESLIFKVETPNDNRHAIILPSARND